MELITPTENSDTNYSLFKIFPNTSKEEKFFPSSASLPIVLSFLDRFNSQVVGTEITKRTIKARVGGLKVKRRIEKVIHISPKKYTKEYSTSSSIEVDWSHRWFTRGHWRKLNTGSLGKNRKGEYIVENRTWVSEHIKGPETLQLESKIRLVK